jgi:hypothetical protein
MLCVSALEEVAAAGLLHTWHARGAGPIPLGSIHQPPLILLLLVDSRLDLNLCIACHREVKAKLVAVSVHKSTELGQREAEQIYLELCMHPLESVSEDKSSHKSLANCRQG